MLRTIGGDIFGGPSGARQQEATLLHRGNDFFTASAPIVVEPCPPFVATELDDEIPLVIDLGGAVEYEELAITKIGNHLGEGALACADCSEAAGGLHGSIAIMRCQPREKAFSVGSLVRAL
jgi:hypothetical protein